MLILQILASVACAPASVQAPAPEGRWQTLERLGEPPLRYALVLPEGYDPARKQAWPTLLALPGGAQDQAAVERALSLHWRGEGGRGWIVACPAAPAGVPLEQGSPQVMVDLLDHLASRFEVEGGRFHVAGASGGGVAAFRLAFEVPERCASLVVLPGYPARPEDFERLERIARLPVAFFAGSKDEAGVEGSERARARLLELGATHVSLLLFSGEGVVPGSLTPARLFAQLESFRLLARAEEGARGAAAAVLDALHEAAARADAAAYFALFAPDAIYLGTDASERWTLAAFRAWALPYFQSGRGWTYRVRERHVHLDPGLGVAWFEERLDNDAYGETRGTGVLRRIGERWRIAQYNLSFPVPNELSRELVERIRALSR